jgi:hypothetical protein
MKKYRNINIEVVSNGFIGTVGCQRVVAENTEKVMELLKKYFDDPVQTEKDLLENHLSFNQGTLHEAACNQGRPEDLFGRTGGVGLAQYQTKDR